MRVWVGSNAYVPVTGSSTPSTMRAMPALCRVASATGGPQGCGRSSSAPCGAGLEVAGSPVPSGQLGVKLLNNCSTSSSTSRWNICPTHVRPWRTTRVRPSPVCAPRRGPGRRADHRRVGRARADGAEFEVLCGWRGPWRAVADGPIRRETSLTSSGMTRPDPTVLRRWVSVKRQAWATHRADHVAGDHRQGLSPVGGALPGHPSRIETRIVGPSPPTRRGLRRHPAHLRATACVRAPRLAEPVQQRKSVARWWAGSARRPTAMNAFDPAGGGPPLNEHAAASELRGVVCAGRRCRRPARAAGRLDDRRRAGRPHHGDDQPRGRCGPCRCCRAGRRRSRTCPGSRWRGSGRCGR